MRIMTLSEMLTALRQEARISPNTAHGAHLNENYAALLRRTQEELYDTYDWPMLRIVQTMDVPADSRYLTYPARLTFEGIQTVYGLSTGADWFPLEYGIRAQHLNEYDSDKGEKSNTIHRWQHYLSTSAETVNQNMFEVWPVPNTATKLRFEGKRALTPLVNDVDPSTIDGPLITLFAAVELLAAQKSEDASVKLQKAQARLDLIKRRQSAPDNRRISMSGSASRRILRPGIDYIP